MESKLQAIRKMGYMAHGNDYSTLQYDSKSGDAKRVEQYPPPRKKNNLQNKSRPLTSLKLSFPLWFKSQSSNAFGEHRQFKAGGCKREDIGFMTKKETMPKKSEVHTHPYTQFNTPIFKTHTRHLSPIERVYTTGSTETTVG